MSPGTEKALKITWLVAAAIWTFFCLGAAFLGAGMSVSAANIEPAFFFYWLGPIVLPPLVFILFRKVRKGPMEE